MAVKMYHAKKPAHLTLLAVVSDDFNAPIELMHYLDFERVRRMKGVCCRQAVDGDDEHYLSTMPFKLIYYSHEEGEYFVRESSEVEVDERILPFIR